MPKFTLHHAAFVTTTSLKTVARIAPAAAVNIELVYLAVMGSGSVAAASIQHEFGASFLSGAGAGTLTSYTPEQAKQASRAAQGTYGVNASAEPTTYSANPFLFGGFNQLNGFVWGVPEGQGFLADASQTVDNHGVRVRSSAAGNVDFNAHVIEP